MSHETLASWEGELPQGSLRATLLHDPETGDNRFFHKKAFFFKVEALGAGPGTVTIGHNVRWNTRRLGGVQANAPDARDFSDFSEALPMLGAFYERVLTQAQEDNLELPSELGGTLRFSSEYILYNEDLKPSGQDVLAFMLLASHNERDDFDPAKLPAWLASPPRCGSPLELYYMLTAPLAAFANPWEHIFLYGNHQTLSMAVPQGTLKQEKHRGFLHGLTALASLAPVAGVDALHLAGVPLADAGVTLETWNPHELLSLKSVDALSTRKGTLEWRVARNLSTMPLAKAGFREYLSALTLRDVHSLLSVDNFRRGMAAEVAIAHAKNALGGSLPAPTIAERTRLYADATQEGFEDQEVCRVQELGEAILNIWKHPALYACMRAYLDECVSLGEIPNKLDIFILAGFSAKRWCAREAEMDAVLINLVKHLGAQEAQRLVREVAALRRPLNTTQWHTYVTQATKDFQGLPAVMWTKLV